MTATPVSLLDRLRHPGDEGAWERFVLALHQIGSVTPTYRAWDRTQGTAGQRFAIGGTGGPPR
jgi:hypothetical protein